MAAQARDVLNRKDVERIFQDKLKTYQGLIAEGRISDLKEAVRDLTHKDTIILLEFDLQLPNVAALPPQKAYFNRDPFVDLIGNAGALDKNSFSMTYHLDKFSPQYGGGSAILFDSGTARGRMTEPYSGQAYDFTVTQKCRNTISADAVSSFKIDSIYCRMQIQYMPDQSTILAKDGGHAKALEKPAIADIMSDLDMQ
ncbi:MAG: hypothetical protein H6855_04840 [Rhodospirillales bacterium]|nr:hypothetical protein [Rhodospirillales bacterium]MCB9965390.1 hypothetical protein [Rhodospirillales bacterium]MCB9973285.1 hypothetical protein [Rhodospirillales bacterium]